MVPTKPLSFLPWISEKNCRGVIVGVVQCSAVSWSFKSHPACMFVRALLLQFSKSDRIHILKSPEIIFVVVLLFVVIVIKNV